MNGLKKYIEWGGSIFETFVPDQIAELIPIMKPNATKHEFQSTDLESARQYCKEQGWL